MNKEYFIKNSMKEIKRRTEIQKITKTTIKKSTRKSTISQNQARMRMSTGNIGRNQGILHSPQEEPEDDPDEFMTAYEEENKSHQSEAGDKKSIDDGQSFKSFANDLGNDGGSIASSIHESEFDDAVDEVDYWRLDHNQQHFSLNPILTINSFKNIGKSIRKRYDKVKLYSSLRSSKEGRPSQELSDSIEQEVESNFHFSHHFIDPESFLIESDDESDEENEIRLEDLKISPIKEKEIENSIEINIDIQRHFLDKKQKTVSLIDIDIKTQNIFIELTPCSIIHA